MPYRTPAERRAHADQERDQARWDNHIAHGQHLRLAERLTGLLGGLAIDDVHGEPVYLELMRQARQPFKFLNKADVVYNQSGYNGRTRVWWRADGHATGIALPGILLQPYEDPNNPRDALQPARRLGSTESFRHASTAFVVPDGRIWPGSDPVDEQTYRVITDNHVMPADLTNGSLEAVIAGVEAYQERMAAAAARRAGH